MNENQKEDEEICPICGSDELERQGRCITCIECGWSKCEI